MRVLLTGANGFIGNALEQQLRSSLEHEVTPVVRHKIDGLRSAKRVGNLDGSTQWSNVLGGVDVVIHTAASIEVEKRSGSSLMSEFRRVNVEGTSNLARQAAQAGVKRFIFISSIKVNGELSPLGKLFTPDDQPVPQDPYGISKYEAEVDLNRLANETSMEVVIIRSPLVYGPGVKGNFASMVRMLERRIPLPLGAIQNKRSLVALDNLVDLIVTCIEHPDAANQTFLAGDGEDLSTTELLQRLGKALGKSARLLPLPASLLMFMAVLIGKKAIAQRLCGSLQVDISKTRRILGWEPPITVDEGLRRAVEGFKK